MKKKIFAIIKLFLAVYLLIACNSKKSEVYSINHVAYLNKFHWKIESLNKLSEIYVNQLYEETLQLYAENGVNLTDYQNEKILLTDYELKGICFVDGEQSRFHATIFEKNNVIIGSIIYNDQFTPGLSKIDDMKLIRNKFHCK